MLTTFWHLLFDTILLLKWLLLNLTLQQKHSPFSATAHHGTFLSVRCRSVLLGVAGSGEGAVLSGDPGARPAQTVRSQLHQGPGGGPVRALQGDTHNTHKRADLISQTHTELPNAKSAGFFQFYANYLWPCEATNQELLIGSSGYALRDVLSFYTPLNISVCMHRDVKDTMHSVSFYNFLLLSWLSWPTSQVKSLATHSKIFTPLVSRHVLIYTKKFIDKSMKRKKKCD